MLKQRRIDYPIKHCYMISEIASREIEIALYKKSLNDDYYKEKSRKDSALAEIEKLENELSKLKRIYIEIIEEKIINGTPIQNRQPVGLAVLIKKNHKEKE